MKADEAWIKRPDDAERIDRPSLLLLADGSDTGGALTANRLYLEPGEPGTTPHYHRGSSEAFYIVNGSLLMLTGNDIETLPHGSLVVVPPGLPHAFAAPAGDFADVLVTLTPGVDRFAYFRLLPDIMAGRVSDDELAEVHDRYDVHFVESAPWESLRGSAT